MVSALSVIDSQQNLSPMVAEATGRQDIGSLYSGHSGWLRNWLCRRLGCPDTAADLAQDTFVCVLLRNAEGISIREPRAYLTRIARGLVVNLWRRKDIERAYLEALAQLPEAETPSPEQNEIILETLYSIDAALDRLPCPVKQAFLLAQLEGVKYRDIAQRLALSEITIKRYVKQALVQCLLALE